MIANDFNEEYFRVENNLTTNEETPFIDRTGRLILTTPFLTGPRIQDDRVEFAGQNLYPKNANFILDSITLYSTNPDISNYLPLKLNISNKQQVEFSDATVTTLNDYNIVVDPPINLQTINNRRYDRLINHCLTTAEQIPNIVNVVNKGTDTYYLVKTEDQFAVEENVLFLVDSTGNVTEPLNTTEFSQIYSSNTFAVGLETVDPTTIRLWDLVSGDNVTVNGVIHLVDIFIQGDTLIVMYVQSVSLRLLIDFFTRQNNEICKYLTYDTGLTYPATPYPIAGLYKTTVLYIYDTLGVRQLELVDNLNPNPTVENTLLFNPELNPGENVINIFIGGVNIKEPNITLITREGNEIWRRLYGFEGRSLKRRELLSVWDTSDLLIKRYRNQAYFTTGDEAILINLDNGEIVHYRYLEQPDVITRIIALGTNRIHLSDSAFITAGVSPELFSVIGNRYENDRTLNQVYKLTYNYQERVFPFNITQRSHFEFNIPNNTPISDLEIFKYVIDYRVRYSKEKQTVNEAKIIPKRKANLRHHTVEEVLGDVPEDFTVNDFLNIYK